MLSDYWFIYIIFVPMGLFFGRSFLTIYGTNPLHYIADFFGVSYLFFEFNATMNFTWWFMSIIIVYYLIFPLLYKALSYSAELLFLLSLLILFLPISNVRELTVWLCPFVFGMYLAKYNIFDILARLIKSIPKAVSCTLIAMFIMAFRRYKFFHNSTRIDFAFAFTIILFSFLVLSRIPVLNVVLERLGKYSGAIFMFHTFIYSYYFRDFIYGVMYSPLIFVLVVVVCCAIAVGLDLLKKVVRYDKLISKVIRKWSED